MIKERICSYELSMLLQEKGFKELCRYCYGTAVRHNGKDIDEDEEFELKSEGRADEIEYIKGGVLHDLYYDNDKSFGKDVCAAPTHQTACDWLREIYHICITIYPDKEKGFEAVFYDIESDVEITLQSFGVYGYHIFENSYGEVVEAALKYSLENLI